MRKYVRARLGERLPEDRLGPAMDLFMGEHAPHEWPIQRPEVEALGIPVTPTDSKWAEPRRSLSRAYVVIPTSLETTAQTP
jgi:hypothetical protein